jgi:hypothetical protein
MNLQHLKLLSDCSDLYRQLITLSFPNTALPNGASQLMT